MCSARETSVVQSSPSSSRDMEFSEEECEIESSAFGIVAFPEPMSNTLRERHVPKLVIWQLEHQKLMSCFFCFKLIVAVGIGCLAIFTDLHVYWLGYKAGISTATMQVAASAVALFVGSRGVVDWYCWSQFLTFDSNAYHKTDASNLMLILLGLIRETDSNDLFARACSWQWSALLMIVTTFLFVIVDVWTDSTVVESLWWVFTREPLVIILGLMTTRFVQPLGAVLRILVEQGTEQVITSFSAKLQTRDLDWKALTKEHKHMDDLLERVWYDNYGWRILFDSFMKSVFTFIAGIVIAIAKLEILRMIAIAQLVGMLYLMTKRIYLCASYTEMCIKTSAGVVRGHKSIMRIASDMFGELADEERDAHANFVMYLKVTQCGVELPMIGLITMERVSRFALQILTVVPTGLTIALTVLHNKAS